MAPERQSGDWAAWMGTPASEPASGQAPPTRAVVVAPGPEPRVEPPVESVALQADADPISVPADEGTENDPEAGSEHARSARREATRQRLLDASREVFAERGVIGGTVEDICERAGYTRGAFYSNFTDKDDVLQALVQRDRTLLLEHLDASFAAVDRELAEALDLESVLDSIVDRILRSIPFDRQLSLVQTELEIHAIRRPELSRELIDSNNDFRERIGAFIEMAMNRHGRELLVSPADITDTMVAVAERSVRRALLAGRGADPDALASAVLPRVLLALSRPLDA